MKRYFTGLLFLAWAIGSVGISNAEPERLAIKDATKRTKELAAEAQIKNIDLQDIEDPAARRAIQEIMNYLGLESKK